MPSAIVGRRGGERGRGQALAEFALVIPVLLALAGVLIDVARVYQTWMTLEQATRDAAQYLATSDPDPCDNDYSGTPGSGCTLPATADEKARYLLGLGTGRTFTISSSQTTCNDPLVTTTYSEDTSSANGGSTAYPVGISTVTTCLPFKTLFAYPFLTTSGNWVVRSEQTYRVLIGR